MKNTHTRVAILLLLLPLALAAVACGDDNAATGPSAVLGGTWKLGTLQRADFSVPAIPPGDIYNVTFGSDGRLSAQADCNACNAAYQIDGESLQIGALACTRAFCGEDSLDRDYLDVLGNARSFESDDEILTIYSSRGLLRFTK